MNYKLSFFLWSWVGYGLFQLVEELQDLLYLLAVSVAVAKQPPYAADAALQHIGNVARAEFALKVKV